MNHKPITSLRALSTSINLHEFDFYVLGYIDVLSSTITRNCLSDTISQLLVIVPLGVTRLAFVIWAQRKQDHASSIIESNCFVGFGGSISVKGTIFPLLLDRVLLQNVIH